MIPQGMKTDMSVTEEKEYTMGGDLSKMPKLLKGLTDKEIKADFTMWGDEEETEMPSKEGEKDPGKKEAGIIQELRLSLKDLRMAAYVFLVHLACMPHELML